jgi:hypothetical protein
VKCEIDFFGENLKGEKIQMNWKTRRLNLSWTEDRAQTAQNK